MKLVAGLFFLPLIFGSFDAYAQETVQTPPSPLVVSDGYSQKAVGSELGNAVSFTFDFEDGFIVAEKVTEKKGEYYRIVKFGADGQTTVLLERTSQPILSLSFGQGKLYAVTRGRVMVLSQGKFQDVIAGLPAYGDYGMSPLVFYGKKMYFGLGTTTNAGIVGADNAWLESYPSAHDLVCADVKVAQSNIQTENFLTKKKGDKALTGPFKAFNTPLADSGIIRGSSRCSGAVYEANFDGTGLQVYAWGFHYPKSLSLDERGNLYVLDQGMEDRGARPIKHGVDSLFQVSAGIWHGWPDYNGGNPVTAEALLTTVPNTPPLPLKTLPLGNLQAFAVAPQDFLPQGSLALTSDNKIVQTKLTAPDLNDFITINPALKVKPVIRQIKFGPDNKLYVLVNAGKQSQLYRIEAPATASMATTQSSSVIKLSSSMMSNLMLLVLGVIAVWFVNARQRPTI